MPQTLAIWVTSALIEIGVGAATTAFIGNAILAAGWIGIAGLAYTAANLLGIFGGGNLPKPADGKQAKKQPIPPRLSGFGICRVGGYYMLYEEKDGVAYLIIAMHDGLVEEFVSFYLTDFLVTVIGGVVDEGADGRYAQDKVAIQTRLGLSTETAYSDVVTALSPIWTADHRGDGIASMMMICGKVAAEDFGKVYPDQLPQPSAVMKLQKVWDPREVGQSYSDASTWTWSENPVLHLLHYITQPNGMDQDVVTRIVPELDSWKSAADVCEEQVALKAGGTEARYKAGGLYQHDNDPADVIGSILQSFDGWLGETGSGALKIVAGKYYAPTVTITANHITGFSVRRYTPDEEAINQLDFSYTSPSHKYGEVQGQSWRDEADISARGRTRAKTLNLTWVQSHPQCRRLTKREMIRSTSDAKGSIVTDLAGLEALGERYVNIQIPDLPSLGTFPVQVSNVQIDTQARSLSFDWIKVGPEIDAWDEDTEEGDPPPDLDEVESDGAESAITAAPTNVLAADGVGASNVTWRNPNSFNFSYAKVFRAAHGSPFSSAVAVSGNLVGGLGENMSFSSSGSAGWYDFWVVAYTAENVASTPGGPNDAIIA